MIHLSLPSLPTLLLTNVSTAVSIQPTLLPRQPSLRYAEKFRNHNHPHHAIRHTSTRELDRGEKDLKFYDWKTTTLGRHCVIGGCGEQLDLWDEGQVSEFGQFGSGITNYFKFLKWCWWIMFILAIANTPCLILNSFGTGTSTVQGSARWAALTTVGNLGDSYNTTTVNIPFCDADEYQQHDCTMPKSELAYYYSVLDCACTLFVVIGWLWLRSFEKKESENLDRATVTASDFTIRITKLPPDTTEVQLAGHFAKITACSVVDVNLAYDNSGEIDLYLGRGKLMKQRFLLVHKIRYHLTPMCLCKSYFVSTWWRVITLVIMLGIYYGLCVVPVLLTLFDDEEGAAGGDFSDWTLLMPVEEGGIGEEENASRSKRAWSRPGPRKGTRAAAPRLPGCRRKRGLG